MKKLTLTLIALGAVLTSVCGQTLPEKPIRYFNDALRLITPARAIQFNEQLAQFERDTSNQFVVAIYPYSPYLDNADVFDLTQRTANTWGVGQRDKRNGLVLFVFLKPDGHGKIQIQVSYGLEGAIPDITAKQVIMKMSPYFKSHEYDNAFTVAINELISAASKEYKGSGKTNAEQPSQIVKEKNVDSILPIVIAFIVCILGAMIAVTAYIFHLINKRREKDRELDEAAAEALRRHSQEARRNLKPSHNRTRSGKVTPRYIPSPPLKRNTSYVPIPVPIPVSRHDDDDDDHSSSSSSSSSDSESSMSSFESGGGSFGGGGSGGDV